MTHEMKLQAEYFDFIKTGTKRIELRLNDEKRSIIKIGDNIEFLKEPAKEEKLSVKVIGLLRYSSFKDLFNDFDISMLSDSSMSKDELINVLQKFYTIEEQKKHSVLGIRIELV